MTIADDLKTFKDSSAASLAALNAATARIEEAQGDTNWLVELVAKLTDKVAELEAAGVQLPPDLLAIAADQKAAAEAILNKATALAATVTPPPAEAPAAPTPPAVP